MARFKDGPFRVAIEKQIPLVPVTIPYNWIILPDDGKMMVTKRTSKLIFHEPIITEGLSIQDMDELKDRVYKIINDELIRYNSLKMNDIGSFTNKNFQKVLPK